MNEEYVNVTAYVKYDQFPFYNVILGTLTSNGGIKTSFGTFNESIVIKVFPSAVFNDHRNKLEIMRANYRSGIEELQKQLLEQSPIAAVK